MNHVAGGITTAVVMSSFKLLGMGNENATDADRRLREFEQKLRDAHIQVEQLKRRNKALEEQLDLMVKGKDTEKRGTAMGSSGRENCSVLGDSIVRDVEAGRSRMMVECFPGIRTNWED